MESMLHYLIRIFLKEFNNILKMTCPEDFLSSAGFQGMSDKEIEEKLEEKKKRVFDLIDKERQWWSKEDFKAIQEVETHNFIIRQALLRKHYDLLGTEQSERE